MDAIFINTGGYGKNETQTKDHRSTGQNTTSYATEMSKMIFNLPKFHWRRTLPRSDIADI